MSKQHEKQRFETLIQHADYPPEAFKFVQQGLAFTVEQVHGKATDAEERLHRWMSKQKIDYGKLCDLYQAGRLTEEIVDLVDQAGGLEKINRHVTGEQLCWGLRDLALQNWGMMAPVVLRKWGIQSTMDFGRMIFFLVEHRELQKQPEDTIEDFMDVYDFRTAFQPGLTA